MVEQRFCKPKVAGSIPASGTSCPTPPEDQSLRHRVVRAAHAAQRVVVATMARETSPIRRMRTGIGSRVLAIITATA